ncbi:MAG: hypothetical protein ACQESP_12905, partial [Candidatus Muiribacteriota bacterium]
DEEIYSILNFPKGIKTGHFFHEILEEIDFTSGINLDNNKIIDEKFKKFKIKSEWKNVVKENIKNILNAQLKSDNNTFNLKEISNNNKIAEKKFFVHKAKQMGKDFFIDNIQSNSDNTILEKLKKSNLKLSFNEFRGFISGLADLIIKYENKYYIIDWKSSYLGEKINDYSYKKIEDNIIKRNYFIQYWIYSEALHKHLKNTIKNYSYQEHFGGVFYIYTRGVNPDYPENGIYFTKLPEDFLESGKI